MGKKIILLLSCFFLFSCGFHLRGSYQLPPNLKAIYLQSSTPYSPLMNQLRQSLKASQVNVVDDPMKAPFTLNIQSENLSTSQTSIGGSEVARQYTVTYSASYTLQDAKGKTIFGPRTASTQTTLTLMSNEELTSSSKLNDTKLGMTQELVSQILFQLSSKNARAAMK